MRCIYNKLRPELEIHHDNHTETVWGNLHEKEIFPFASRNNLTLKNPAVTSEALQFWNFVIDSKVCSWPDYRGSQYQLLQIWFVLQSICSALQNIIIIIIISICSALQNIIIIVKSICSALHVFDTSWKYWRDFEVCQFGRQIFLKVLDQ